jgi:hypothetical protein
LRILCELRVKQYRWISESKFENGEEIVFYNNKILACTFFSVCQASTFPRPLIQFKRASNKI